MSITCPRCNKSGLRRYVDLGLDIPVEFEGNLTRKNVYSKQTKQMCAMWDRGYMYCTQPTCGWNVSFTKNYIDKITSENKRLKNKVTRLEKGKLK